ncbi:MULTISPECIES: DUF2461 domain-containing protein [unclassified Serratia (in: enterobacteria)]|uniref:DUF2461 domain-containing protein n=1 Tax=unclassified Serratia (in: enterobacteria) TaxID=2647522 RepID=UPI0005022376|nr:MULTISPECIES: DUF2461 domain-containing protein [unclassified Serratia (in: enterobacteria)]KFK92717.1 hypothetical protein JV45_19880 [Serratia sp. Ag2]KFK94228.1 hypothetical protein IV04_22525 [Serratia sp. Ag1]
MANEFTGFSQQGLNFLQQVRIENDKEWFEANRDVYDRELLTPFRALVEALSQAMLAIDPYFETRPAIGKTLSRIHRDTRFSHDKSRYRSRMWLTFKRPSKDWKDAPVYFFELGPDMLRYGLGYYSANKPTMDLFRHTLRQRPQPFLAVSACCRAPFELVGESYKRPLVKEQAPEIATWYNRKSFAVMVTDNQVEKLFSAELVSLLTQGFLQLEPLYHWLMQVEAMKQIDPADL